MSHNSTRPTRDRKGPGRLHARPDWRLERRLPALAWIAQLRREVEGRPGLTPVEERLAELELLEALEAAERAGGLS